MDKFSVRFFDGSCKVFECKSVFGVRFLARMYLSVRKNDIDVMLCFVGGEIWKWKCEKWEKKRECNKNVSYKYCDVEKLEEWRERSEMFDGRQRKIIWE